MKRRGYSGFAQSSSSLEAARTASSWKSGMMTSRSSTNQCFTYVFFVSECHHLEGHDRVQEGKEFVCVVFKMSANRNNDFPHKLDVNLFQVRTLSDINADEEPDRVHYIYIRFGDFPMVP